MMEFMRPLAVEKRQNDNTAAAAAAAAAPRVSRSVGHSVTQTASQPSPPEHCNHHQKQNPTIINHSSQSCIQVAGVRTSAVFPDSVHEVIVSVELVAYIAPPYCTNGSNSKSSTNQTNQHQRQFQHSQGALVRPAASGSVKEKAVRQTTRTYQLTAS